MVAVTGNRSTFLDVIFNSGGAGIVEFTLPSSDGSSTNTMSGYVADTVSFRLGNSWQQVLPNTGDFTKFQQAMGSQNLTTFLNSTQASWSGAEPLGLSINFYLFSTSPNSKIKDDFYKLAQLATVNVRDELTIRVHGGYASDLTYYEGAISPNASSRKNLIDNARSSTSQGLITIKLGNQMTFDGMLLTDITPEISTIEVPNKEPLFIRVSANFRSFMTMTDKQLKRALNL